MHEVTKPLYNLIRQVTVSRLRKWLLKTQFQTTSGFWLRLTCGSCGQRYCMSAAGVNLVVHFHIQICLPWLLKSSLQSSGTCGMDVPGVFGCMATAAVVCGNTLTMSRVMFCLLNVFPSKKMPCMSTSVPSPKVYQTTLSPAHMCSPGRFPYMRPFTAADTDRQEAGVAGQNRPAGCH